MKEKNTETNFLKKLNKYQKDMPTKATKFKLKQIVPNSDIEKRLFSLWQKSLIENITIEQFRKRLSLSEEYDFVIFSENGIDMGFTFLSVTKIKDITVLRPIIGVIPKYRGKFNVTTYSLSIIKHKLKNPFKKVFMLSAIINPKVYLGLCKYWHQTYPNPKLKTPNNMLAIFDLCKQHFKFSLFSKNVVKYPFSFLLTDKEVQRIADSMDNEYIRFFRQHISDNEWNKGLLTLTPVNLANFVSILATAMRKMLRF